jgi:predicted nucleic acid-binding protein
MAETEVLIDTGSIVGLLSRRDQYHVWAKRQTAHLEWPFYTCEAVLSESVHLLGNTPADPLALIDLLERDLIKVPFSYAEHAGPVHELMRTYADQPMSFADAGLVRMAGRRRAAQVLTTDADFRVYRTAGGEALDVLAPGGP